MIFLDRFTTTTTTTTFLTYIWLILVVHLGKSHASDLEDIDFCDINFLPLTSRRSLSFAGKSLFSLDK